MGSPFPLGRLVGLLAVFALIGGAVWWFGLRPRGDPLAQGRAAARARDYDRARLYARQAGLAVGYFLAQQDRRFTILEAAGEPAAAWRGRWDSLKLFTPVRRDGLPGRAFPGDPDSYPSRDEVVAYLEDYARDFQLPVELNSRVLAVRGTRVRNSS